MFLKYQHIERFGASKVMGIEKGLCHIFPKIDGTNGVVWLENGEIKAGSRNRELTLEEDNRGFFKTILKDKGILEYLKQHPRHRLFGEWLVPHTLKTYEENAWNKFYVFDVAFDIENEGLHYISYENYHEELEKFNIEHIKPLKVVENPSYEMFEELLQNNKFLIKQDNGVGEGIVIKNYNFIYRGDNKQKWAKIISSEFKQSKNHTEKTGTTEEKIIDKFCTSAFIEKEYAKMKEEIETMERKNAIHMILNKIYNELIEEEIWNIIKQFKDPIVEIMTFGVFLLWLCEIPSFKQENALHSLESCKTKKKLSL